LFVPVAHALKIFGFEVTWIFVFHFGWIGGGYGSPMHEPCSWAGLTLLGVFWAFFWGCWVEVVLRFWLWVGSVTPSYDMILILYPKMTLTM
jgi:hypothetical protein